MADFRATMRQNYNDRPVMVAGPVPDAATLKLLGLTGN